jgi:hypothetical protein
MMVAVFFVFGDNDESAQDGEDAEFESPSIARGPLGRAVGLAMLVVPGSFAGAPDTGSERYHALAARMYA